MNCWVALTPLSLPSGRSLFFSFPHSCSLFSPPLPSPLFTEKKLVLWNQEFINSCWNIATTTAWIAGGSMRWGCTWHSTLARRLVLMISITAFLSLTSSFCSLCFCRHSFLFERKYLKLWINNQLLRIMYSTWHSLRLTEFVIYLALFYVGCFGSCVNIVSSSHWILGVWSCQICTYVSRMLTFHVTIDYLTVPRISFQNASVAVYLV